MKINKLQQEIREKVIAYSVDNFKKDYDLTYQDIADIFSEGITKEGVRKIEIRLNQNKINEKINK